MLLTIANAAERLLELTRGADSCVIFDLRTFRAPISRTDLNRPSASPDATRESSTRRPSMFRRVTSDSSGLHSSEGLRFGYGSQGLNSGQGVVTVLASSGGYDWASAVQRPGTNAAVSRTLVTHNTVGPFSDLLKWKLTRGFPRAVSASLTTR